MNRVRQQIKDPYGQEIIRVMLQTEHYVIQGELELPIPSVVDNPTTENLLFYTINCGNMFLALRNCTISSKTKAEYQPEEVAYYNINLGIVHSIQIIE